MPSWEQIFKGTNGDDIIDGTAGDDYLQGRAGDDILRGFQGNDLLHGDADDDYLVGGEGDDTIDGGTGGIDVAVFSGSVKDYTFWLQGGNAYISHTGGTQLDGTDWLIHIEFLLFNDALIDLNSNNAPIAYDDSASTNEDVGVYSSGSASVLDNDFDWEGSSLSVTPGV
jgi:Ca2+-binding RTX toxin-like protein